MSVDEFRTYVEAATMHAPGVQREIRGLWFESRVDRWYALLALAEEGALKNTSL